MLFRSLVKTKEYHLKSEGLISLPFLLNILGENVAKFPIIQALKEIIVEHKDAKIAFTALIEQVLLDK